MHKFMWNLGVFVLFVVLSFLVSYKNYDFGCGFSWYCHPDNSGQQIYVLIGQILVCLNLWAAFFYVNVDFFRGDSVTGRDLAGPAILSTLLTTVTFVSAMLLVSALLFIYFLVTGTYP